MVAAWGDEECDLRRGRGLPPAAGPDPEEHGLGQHVSCQWGTWSPATNNHTISQDLSTWCGGVTSFYKGLFYTIANINLPLFVQKEGDDYFVPFLESIALLSVSLMNCFDELSNWGHKLRVLAYCLSVNTSISPTGSIITGGGAAAPYIRPGDVLMCEITLAGTDYKTILYTKLNSSNLSTGSKHHTIIHHNF